MVRIRVIAAQGATLRGPLTVKLSKAQWARREAVLGPVPDRLKQVILDGRQELHFKYGEELAVEAFEGRLNAGLFEDLDAAAAAAEEAKAEAEKKAAEEEAAKKAAEEEAAKKAAAQT